MEHHAIIFDLDGTLLDTLADIANAANEVLRARQFPTYETHEYRQFIGEGVARLFTQALPVENRDPEIVQWCVARFHEVYLQHWNVETQPYAGIDDLLDQMTSRRILMAVLSNKPHAFTRRCIAHYFRKDLFQIVLGQRDHVPRKPDPAGAVEIVQHWQLDPQQVVYLGDSAIDMQTAIAAGLLPVGVGWGFRSRDELRAAGAELIIEQPAEVLTLFD